MKPAILSFKPFIQFGGQAGAWFDELKRAWDGCPSTKPLIEAVNGALQKEFEKDEARASGYLGYGIDIVSWLDGKRPTPVQAYLSSSVISQPCIFLTQAANLLFADSNGLNLKELLRLAKGTAGHSQGIMTAVLFAMGLSGDKYVTAACNIARWLFWQGIRMQQAWPMYAVAPALVKRAKEDGVGAPTPMAAVSGIMVEDVEKLVTEFNCMSFPPPIKPFGGKLQRESKVNKGDPSAAANGDDTSLIYISLRNTFNRAVLSGPPELLLLFNHFLKNTIEPSHHLAIAPVFEFIPTSAPFHSPYMKKGLEKTTADLARLGIKFSAKSLKIPIFATNSGKNLQKSTNLMQDLLEMMHIHPVDWIAVCAAIHSTKPTHIIDFGPGDAAAKLSGINCQGRGISVISFSTEADRHQLFSANPDDVKMGKDWNEYRPRVFRITSHEPRATSDERRATTIKGNKLALYNRYVEYTSSAPIFGAGMTPTTTETDIVIAAANAGYIVELAGGGQVTEEIFRQRLDEIVKKLKPNAGIIVNTLFLDPYLWNLHYNLLPQLKAEGYPIIGVTITAGIPEKEKAVEILKTFNKAGIWCNALKPGTDAQIEQVLEIADAFGAPLRAPKRERTRHYSVGGQAEPLPYANLNTQTLKHLNTLLMHVEGGFAGGHHSWEDLHGLILRNYAKIRQRENIILCVGGGIWNEEQAFKWLNGDWHGIPEFSPMPVDAVFLGTRLLAVKEAKTSPAVKKFLVEISGHNGWVKKGEVKGGVTSAESHLGADIYYAENSAAKASRLLDSLAGKKDEIIARRSEIIEAINKTCKPYFGDMEKMTYAEVLRRMIELMAPGGIAEHILHDGDWYDVTFKTRVWEFVKRTEERLGWQIDNPPYPPLEKGGNSVSPPLKKGGEGGFLNDPQKFLREFLKKYPAAETTILHPEDADYFIWLCKRPGKPVNFVPVIDEDVRRWFKSDSLWQAHDPRYPADAVFTLPGPAAVQGIKRVDEPVVGVLGGFEGYIAGKLASGGKVTKLPSYQVTKFKGSQLVNLRTCELANLYNSLWGSKKSTRVKFKIKRKDIEKYVAATGEMAKAFTHGIDGKLLAPLNMAFIFAWKPVTAIMWRELEGADLFKLVHLSNRIVIPPLPPFSKGGDGGIFEGDEIECTAKSGGASVTKSGTILSVLIDILKDGEKVIEMESKFFVRGFKKRSLVVGRQSLVMEKIAVVPLKSPIELFSDSMRAPMDNKIYADASDDHNPIHINKDVAFAAGFKSAIVHGMWTSSSALAKINAHLAADEPSRVKEWDVNFESPVFPEEELKISVHHSGNINGNMAVEAKVTNSESVTVLQGHAQIAPPKTAYIFTGQGSQEQGMGMDGYGRSAAARAIWNESDAYCRNELGFSILKVVRDNPVAMLVGKNEVRHLKGVLNLTQFTQVGLTVLAMAHVAELKEAQVYADGAIFCGHSLGEYAALSCSGIIPLKQVIKTVYNRGLTMQNFVPRDEHGVSPYKMCVVRPNIVKMKQNELGDLINGIVQRENGALEIVNYNIEGEQYSVTGEKRLLSILETELKRREKDVGATKPSIIFLEGIDVPFHSKVLRPGVDAFRKTLEATIPKDLNPALLVDRYIPNLNAKLFELTREYIEGIYGLTGSPILNRILSKTQTPMPPDPQARLLLIELLAYQFASPVQWIDTQKVLFGSSGTIARIIEIGSQPVLANMARRSLAKMQMRITEPVIMHVSADRKSVFYEG